MKDSCKLGVDRYGSKSNSYNVYCQIQSDLIEIRWTDKTEEKFGDEIRLQEDRNPFPIVSIYSIGQHLMQRT
jgi:hypothetical protein